MDVSIGKVKYCDCCLYKARVYGVIQELVFILILERIINCYCSNYISLWRTLLIEL